jgi:hemolysin activation/secretion protein
MALMLWRLPLVGSDTRVILHSNAQYSGMNLSSIVRFSLAGASRVRAFSPNLYSADDAFYAGVDWVFNNPVLLGFNKFKNTLFQESVKPMLFVDYGWGKQYSLVPDEADVRGVLSSAGFGFQFAYGAQFKANLQFAFPVKYKFSKPDVVSSESSMRTIFDLQSGFGCFIECFIRLV